MIGSPDVRCKSHTRIAYAIVKDFEIRLDWVDGRRKESTEIHQLWDCALSFLIKTNMTLTALRCPCIGLQPLGPWISQGKIIASCVVFVVKYAVVCSTQVLCACVCVCRGGDDGSDSYYFPLYISCVQQGILLHILLSWTGLTFRRSRATHLWLVREMFR